MTGFLRTVLPFPAGIPGAFDDTQVIAGGGLAAIFTAYEIQRRARETGNPPKVVVLADCFNVPCAAGNQVDLRVEGLFRNGVPQHEFLGLLRAGRDALFETVAREDISCRLSHGYEVKATNEAALALARHKLDARSIPGAGAALNDNSLSQAFRLAGHPHSLQLPGMGQLNMRELVAALAGRINAMGGEIRVGESYAAHRAVPGGYEISTAAGVAYRSVRPPVLATGAQSVGAALGGRLNTHIMHTMALVMGPLDAGDAACFSPGPMAFSDSHFDSDFIWGGLDEKRMLTIGWGELSDPSGRDDLRVQIETWLEQNYPGLMKKYPPEESFGAMLYAPNKMPIVGRLGDCVVASGWGGHGIVPGYAAARALASAIVTGHDRDLRVFESLQPGLFTVAVPAMPRPVAGGDPDPVRAMA